jgi:hypothetical protein
MLEIYPVLTEPYELRAIAWSPDANYDHTITIRIDLIRIEDLVALVPILSGLEKFLQYIGVSPKPGEGVAPVPEEEVTPPPEEEVPTPTPPPAPPPTPPPTPPPEEVIPPAPPPEEVQMPGKLLGVQWGNDSGWHNMTDPIPLENSVDGVKALHVKLRFAVENTGDKAGKYKMGLYTPGAIAFWSYSGVWTISPGQGFVDWLIGTGEKGSYTRTYVLFSDSKQVDEITFTAGVV